MPLRSLFLPAITSALIAASATVAWGASPAGPPPARFISPSASWNEPNQRGVGDYSHVAVAIDGRGRLHAAATGNTGIWYLREAPDGTFKRQRISTNLPGGHDDFASIDVDDSNRPHVVFVRWDCDECAPNPPKGIYYSTRLGGSWSGLTKLAGLSMSSPSLKMHAGHIYLAYERCECIPKQTAQVWFLSDLGPGGSLSRVKVDEGGANPSLQLTASGKPRIAFDGHGLWYAKGSRNGSSFSRQLISTDTQGVAAPALALSSSQMPSVAWSRGGSSSTRGLFISTLSGGAFVTLQISSLRTHPSIAMNADDSPLVAACGASGGVWVYKTTNAGFASTTLDDQAVADGIGVVVDPAGGAAHVLYSAIGGVPVGVYEVDGS